MDDPKDIPPPRPRKQESSPELTARRNADKLIPGQRKTVGQMRKSAKEKINRLKREERKLQKEKAAVQSKRSKAQKGLAAVEEAVATHTGKKLLIEDEVKVTPTVAQVVEENVAFRPNTGPQTEFLAASENEVLYGGARGGGKSYAMLVDPLRYCHRKDHRALLLRRTMPELRDLIHKSKFLYKQAYPKAVWRDQEKEWTFPSGARIEFGYAENIDDAMRYQGQAYTWIGIDELGQYPTREIWDLLRGSLRSVDPEIPTHMRATANPGGPGHVWIKDMFIDPEPAYNKTFFEEIKTPLGKRMISRRYIPARLTDNPALMQTEEYMIMLASLPDVKRRQWLEGDWDVTSGAAFPEFDRNVHVCQPFEVPRTWLRFRACDWGYTSPACVLWFAVDYNNTLYVYRELYVTELTADRFALKVRELEKNDPGPIRGVMDSSVWSKRGDVGPTIVEHMARYGINWRPSDRSPGSRKAGRMEVHRRLIVDQVKDLEGNLTHIPRLKIFNTCKKLIATLPVLPVDQDDPEDVDTDSEDHAYDALRYGVMSRPLGPGRFTDWGIRGRLQPPNGHVSDSTFGY